MKLKSRCRFKVKHIEGTMFEYRCPFDHVHKRDINYRKPKHLHISASSVNVFKKGWEKDGLSGTCPECFTEV
jgi:hypothetical protein